MSPPFQAVGRCYPQLAVEKDQKKTLSEPRRRRNHLTNAEMLAMLAMLAILLQFYCNLERVKMPTLLGQDLFAFLLLTLSLISNLTSKDII